MNGIAVLSWQAERLIPSDRIRTGLVQEGFLPAMGGRE
jgi:hypothetical protein